MPDKSVYDHDYYENGIASGKSLYTNYRWIPELTIPMAMTMVDYLGIKRFDSVLDFGCSKGYLVKALRLLHRDAWGVDISDYALSHSDEEIRQYLSREMWPFSFKFAIAKDVFEHIPEEELSQILKTMQSRVLFIVVPLGDNGQFCAPENNNDITHINCFPAAWWEIYFKRCGFTIDRFTYRIDGIKDNYYEKYPLGHGFFTLLK